MKCPTAEALVAAQDWEAWAAHVTTCPACQQGLNELTEAVRENDALVLLEEAWADYQNNPKEDDQS
jgi:hypothetical protein